MPAYSYYVRIAAINAQEPMSGVTVVVEDKGSEAVAKQVIESSRRLYTKEAVTELSAQDQQKPSSDTKGRRSTPKKPSGDQSEGLKGKTSLK